MFSVSAFVEFVKTSRVMNRTRGAYDKTLKRDFSRSLVNKNKMDLELDGIVAIC